MLALAGIAALHVLNGSSAAQAIAYDLSGTAPRDGYTALSPLGDVDADGVPDWLVTSFSGLDGVAFALSGVDFTRIGVGSRDLRGACISLPVPDVDGDGVNDVVTSSLVQLNVAHYYNVLTGALIAQRFIPTGFAFPIGATFELGDIDLDGFVDFALASEFADVAIVSGRTLQVVRFHFIGAQDSNGRPRGKVAPLGDVDGDGAPDYALANWLGNHVPVISGLTGLLIRSYDGGVLDPPYSPDLEGFGTTVVNIGDIDGDGISDLAVTSNRFYTTYLNGGLANDPTRMYAISGASGAELWRIDGLPLASAALSSEFRDGVWEIGDLDGDGFEDLGSLSRIRSSRDGAVLWRMLPDDPLEPFAFNPGLQHEVRGYVGDMTGDGIDDWVMGSGWTYEFRGRIVVLAGAPVRRTPVCDGDINAFGRRAVLTWDGPLTRLRSFTEIVVRDALPLGAGLLFLGPPTPAPPAGQFGLCFGSPARRLGQPLAADATGTLTQRIDWTQPWTDALVPGVTHHLQAIYRDPTRPNGIATSSAIELFITP